MSVITYYTDDDNANDKEIQMDFGRYGNFEVYVVDNDHDGEIVKFTDELKFVMSVHSLIMIKEI